MNFFEYQEEARRRTALLCVYYALAVALIILALYAVVAAVVRYGSIFPSDAPANWSALWDPILLGWVALATGGLILIGTVYKMAVLSSGGDAIAAMLGGHIVHANTLDPAERRLFNVVEEMAIASGTPVPKIYVLGGENGINAFAAGLSPANAVVAVTRGALERLNRDELQGVIAHEFSHILNGDMRLNLRLIGVLNGILLIAMVGYTVFRVLLRSRSRGSRSGKKGGGGAVILAIIVIALAMIIIGYIGVFFARLIKSAVSRQREFLADASAVQFTRNPDGLAGALKKIGRLAAGSAIESPKAEEASHLFFANGLGASFLGLLATHPPLAERIRRLDPSFTGRYERAPGIEPEEAAAAFAAAPGDAANAAAVEEADRPAPPPPPPVAIDPAAIVGSVGTVNRAHLSYAANLLSSLPEALRAAAREPLSAQGIVFGLLLARARGIRERQMTLLTTQAIPAVYRETVRLAPWMANVRPEARLPLAELALCALTNLSAAQYRDFRGLITSLAAADEEIDLFEYALLRIMTRSLDPQFGMIRRRQVRYSTLSPLARECSVLLSAVAWFGNKGADAAAAAFANGLRELGAAPAVSFLPAGKASLEDMDSALDKLAEAAPLAKQGLVAACAACVSADGRVTVEEAEALRAVADALECPLPPFVDTAAA